MGQKNGRARIWAKRGTRPRLPADQRYTNAYLFGAICPRSGKGAALAPVAIGKWVDPGKSVVERGKQLGWVGKGAIFDPEAAIIDEDAQLRLNLVSVCAERPIVFKRELSGPPPHLFIHVTV